MTFVKVCGLSDSLSLSSAIEHGVKFVGFVFYPDSPRFVTIEQARLLSRQVPTDVKVVGLFVNPTDEELSNIVSQVPLDMIQLHGDESPGRVAEIKEKYFLAVMKAIRIAGQEDLEQVAGFEAVADWLLFDTKVKLSDPPPLSSPPAMGGGNIPYGGSGKIFDWSILKDKSFKKPWMLAGGLNINNIEEALSVLSPNAVDVSSSVEKEKGVKDPEKIKAFLLKVREL